MGIALRILVDDTGHGFPILAVQARGPCRSPDVGDSIFAIQADMAFGTIDAVYPVDTFDGNAVFAVFPLNGDSIFAVDGYAGFPVSPVDAHMAILAIGAIFAANGDVVIQGNLQGIAVHSRGNGLSIALHLDGITQSLGDRGIGIISRQAEGLAAHIGTDGICNSLQLIFRSRPAAGDVLRIPLGIAEPGQVIAFCRIGSATGLMSQVDAAGTICHAQLQIGGGECCPAGPVLDVHAIYRNRIGLAAVSIF